MCAGSRLWSPVAGRPKFPTQTAEKEGWRTLSRLSVPQKAFPRRKHRPCLSVAGCCRLLTPTTGLCWKLVPLLICAKAMAGAVRPELLASAELQVRLCGDAAVRGSCMPNDSCIPCRSVLYLFPASMSSSSWNLGRAQSCARKLFQLYPGLEGAPPSLYLRDLAAMRCNL